MQIVTLSLQEKVPPQVLVIRKVESQLEHEIEIHQIDSDLEEETEKTTFSVNIYTSRTSFVPNSHFSRDIFHDLFPQSSFSHVDLKPILEDTSRDALVSTKFPSDIPPLSPRVSSIPHIAQTPTTSSHIPFSQVETPSISTIPFSQTKNAIPTSSTSLISIFPTSTLEIHPLNVEMLVSQSEP